MTQRAFDGVERDWSAQPVTPEEAARVLAALPRHPPMPQSLFDAWDDVWSATGGWSPGWPDSEHFACCTELVESLTQVAGGPAAWKLTTHHVLSSAHLAHRRGVSVDALDALTHTMWRLFWTTDTSDDRDLDEPGVAEDPDWMSGYEWCGALVQMGVPALRARLYRLSGLTRDEACDLEAAVPKASDLLRLITLAALRGNGPIVVRSLGCMTGHGSHEPGDDLPLTALN